MVLLLILPTISIFSMAMALFSGKRRFTNPLGGTQQPELLAGERGEENATRQVSPKRRKEPRQFQQAGRARGVVIRSG